MVDLRCSMCGKMFDAQQSTALPFCSERCRLVDLHGWLHERYGIPVLRTPEDEEQPTDEY